MSEHLTGGEKVVFEGKIFEIIQKEVSEGGVVNLFEFARRSPGVRLIIPTKSGNLLMTKEYRHEHSGFDIRLPGGKVFDARSAYQVFLNSKENILPYAEIAAKNEAREEVGIDIISFQHFATSKVGATVIWDLIYFIVNEYRLLNSGKNLGQGEQIETVELPVIEVEKMCFDGTIKEERSALMILRYLKNLK